MVEKKSIITDTSISKLYSSVREILLSARGKAYAAVNSAMVHSYWQIGKIITEEELGGKQRANMANNC